MIESVGVTVDCGAEALDVLADFWAAALGYEKLLPFLLVDPSGVKPRIAFQVVPEPRTAKNLGISISTSITSTSWALRSKD